MISIDKVLAADYYVEQVARDRHDYLSGEGEAPGVWDGALAEQLGLHGEVSENGFRALLAEQHPVTGERMKRQSNKRVAGWDLTFSPPKSISALWAIAGDDVAAEVRAADEAAGRVGLAFMERHACVARLGRDGVDRQPATGFAAASFTHRTSREGDPQLHTDGWVDTRHRGRARQASRAAAAVPTGAVVLGLPRPSRAAGDRA